MALPPVPDAAVRLAATASTWREAVEHAGAALVAAGATRPGYTGAMIAMIAEYGPYIVIAPGLALAHARPSVDVVRDGLSVVTLAEPVVFGHAHNDPVRVVLGLAVSQSGTHLDSIGTLANVFNDPGATGRLADAKTAEDVRAIIDVGAA